jgi:hypothetical protein
MQRLDWKDPKVQDEIRQGMAAFKAPAYSGGEGRGIVICGGGQRFFASTYATIKVIRRVGCTLPIELWYLAGEREEWMVQATQGLGVEWIDADRVADSLAEKPRILNGWEVKVFAILHSKFEEVISFDSDAYPVVDPTFMFDHPAFQALGSTFFPDQRPEDIDEVARAIGVPDIRAILGMPVTIERGIEAGFFLIDRKKCWEAVNLTWWINNHSDFFYQLMHGDKDTWNIAFRFLGQEYAMTPTRWTWRSPAIVHHGWDGNEIALHRCRSKWVLPNVDGQFITPQDGQKINYTLPHEQFCINVVAELAKFLSESFKMVTRKSVQGNWIGAYGHLGYLIADVPEIRKLPPSFGVKHENQIAVIKEVSPSVLRTVLKRPTAGRVGGYYTNGELPVEFVLSGSDNYKLSIYCLDGDTGGKRQQRIEILDLNAGEKKLFDSGTLTDFSDGIWLTCQISSTEIKVRCIGVGTEILDAVICGIFIG